MIRVKGDASNTRAMMDISSTGTFALAGLRDAASNTIGGGGVQGTLYLSFLALRRRGRTDFLENRG
ncbi:MAG: hypothetical protein ACRDBP_07250 [Luteolibacter sp.]